jgi:hypothetical protein
MASSVRILGAFVDTLYLNVYQTDVRYQRIISIIRGKVA